MDIVALQQAIAQGKKLFPVLDGVSRTLVAPAGGGVVLLDQVWNNPTGYMYHLRTGANTDGSSGGTAIIGIGTDLGTGYGLLISHKNSGVGLLLGGNPGSGVGYYGVQYASSPAMQIDMYNNAGPISLNMQAGLGVNDGVTLKPSTAFVSISASLTSADVGATLAQLTSRGLSSDPLGCIPSGTTITAFNSTTIDAASNGVDISVAATLTLASAAGMPTTGVAKVNTTAGFQVIAYTGITGNQLTGVHAGAGSLVSATVATGGAVTQAVMSAPAGNTGYGILARVGGRTPPASQPVLQQKDTGGTVLWALRKTGLLQYPTDPTKATQSVFGKFGASGNIFEVLQNSAVQAILGVLADGGAVVTAVSGQTNDLLAIQDSNRVTLSRFTKSGRFVTNVTGDPLLANLTDGEIALYTDGAGALKKAQRVGGVLTVKTIPDSSSAGLALAPVPGQWYPVGGATTPAALTLNTAYCYPVVVGANHTYTGLGANITTGGGTGSVCRFGIAADTGSSYPGAVLVDAGTAASTGTGACSITGLTQALTPGLYWLIMVPQVGTAPSATCDTGTYSPVFGSVNPGTLSGGVKHAYAISGVSGALPGTMAAGGTAVGTAPVVSVLA